MASVLLSLILVFTSKNKGIFTIKSLKDLLFDSFRWFYSVLFEFRILVGFDIDISLSLRVGIRQSLNFLHLPMCLPIKLPTLPIASLIRMIMIMHKLSDAIFDITLMFLLGDYFLKEIRHGHIHSLILILAVGTKRIQLIIKIGLIATVWYFVDSFRKG